MQRPLLADCSIGHKSQPSLIVNRTWVQIKPKININTVILKRFRHVKVFYLVISIVWKGRNVSKMPRWITEPHVTTFASSLRSSWVTTFIFIYMDTFQKNSEKRLKQRHPDVCAVEGNLLSLFVSVILSAQSPLRACDLNWLVISQRSALRLCPLLTSIFP